MKEPARKELGDDAEQTALKYLLSKGLRPLLRNYRCKGGEIDLVMLDGETLALIEVRLRRSEGFGGAAASVTPAKQKRLIVAAKHLMLSRHDLARRRARFDVVALGDASFGQLKIEWIKDAFRL